MRKALLLFAFSAICLGVAFRYFSPNFSGGAIAEMNQPLPPQAFFLSAANHEWVDLSNYKGQVVLLSFWTTWCPGCRSEVPELIRVQEEFGNQGFTVVGIAVDDDGEQSVGSFIKQKGINYPVLLGDVESARKLGFEGGLPMGVLVNRDGKEVKIIRGVVSKSALAKAIEGLVKD